MAPVRNGHQPGMMALLQGLADDLKTLAAQQVRLALHEVHMEMGRAARIGALSAGLFVLAILTMVVLLFTAAFALHELGGWPLWASFGVTALVLLAGAGGIAYSITQVWRRVRFTPVRTLHTLKEDAQWIKEQLKSPRI